MVEAIDGEAACRSVNRAMERWGCPRRIKIDNGLPFASGGNKDIPSLAQLWWIGLGIEVRLNDVNRPQQNGTVEGLQGICHRWSNPTAHDSIEALQVRLDEALRIQREVYRIRKEGDRTRKELFPVLWQNPRRYDPGRFDIQRVYYSLSAKVWERRVAKGGNIQFWSCTIYVGNKFEHQVVTITCDPIERQWLIRTKDGRLLRTYTKELFTEAQILKHAGISKN